MRSYSPVTSMKSLPTRLNPFSVSNSRRSPDISTTSGSTPASRMRSAIFPMPADGSRTVMLSFSSAASIMFWATLAGVGKKSRPSFLRPIMARSICLILSGAVGCSCKAMNSRSAARNSAGVSMPIAARRFLSSYTDSNTHGIKTRRAPRDFTFSTMSDPKSVVRVMRLSSSPCQMPASFAAAGLMMMMFWPRLKGRTMALPLKPLRLMASSAVSLLAKTAGALSARVNVETLCKFSLANFR